MFIQLLKFGINATAVTDMFLKYLKHLKTIIWEYCTKKLALLSYLLCLLWCMFICGKSFYYFVIFFFFLNVFIELTHCLCFSTSYLCDPLCHVLRTVLHLGGAEQLHLGSRGRAAWFLSLHEV